MRFSLPTRSFAYTAIFMALLTSATFAANKPSHHKSEGTHMPSGIVNTFVPRHTIIPIILTKDIRVGGEGEQTQTRTIKVEVARDVVENGYLIAKQGDLAEGHLTTQRNVTRRYFSQQISQEASLAIDSVTNFCGDTMHMQFERTLVGGVTASTLSFGAHAHDAVFGKGTILKASTDRVEKSICAEPTSMAPLPLPKNILVPDEEVQSK